MLQHLSSTYNDITFTSLPLCDMCRYAKQRRLPFPNNKTRSSHFFKLIHVDIWGLVAHTFVDNFKYFLTIVDVYTRFTWIHFLQYKSMVKTHLPSFVILIENQFVVNLKRLRSDNGKEFF